MATEIERKFLVVGDAWRAGVESQARLVQGYLVADGRITVRVRIAGDAAVLTIKGRSTGISRAEYEYAIPPADAEALLADLAVAPLIDKTRYRVRHGAQVWDLDVFAGDNAGLVLAEIELAREDEPFEVPDWAGAEVSDDRRYYNASLARHPFTRW